MGRKKDEKYMVHVVICIHIYIYIGRCIYIQSYFQDRPFKCVCGCGRVCVQCLIDSWFALWLHKRKPKIRTL